MTLATIPFFARTLYATVAIMLVVSTSTNAYLSDVEISTGNIFAAGEWNDSSSPFNVVLNEFLPRPDTSANGLNFGTDSSNMPLGEWVELYNNGTEPIDIANWYIADESGGAGNTQAVISSSNTQPATTTIPSKGWLVVYFNKPVLNNTGDSIYLYTDTGMLVDSYTYDNPSDFCEDEPTPGSTNASSTPAGTPGSPPAPCNQNQVAPNKSYARIPDGTGEWIDPIPTPGGQNIPDVPLPEVKLSEAAIEISSGEAAKPPAEALIIEVSEPLVEIVSGTTTEAVEDAEGTNAPPATPSGESQEEVSLVSQEEPAEVQDPQEVPAQAMAPAEDFPDARTEENNHVLSSELSESANETESIPESFGQ